MDSYRVKVEKYDKNIKALSVYFRKMRILNISDKRQKEIIVKKCDSVFSIGILRREDGENTLNKIVTYAQLFAAYDESFILAGYVAFYVNDLITKTAYITMLGVVEKMRKKHVGSQLLKACLNRAAECGMEKVRLEVDKRNERAIKFYEYWGFRYESEKSKYSILMLKDTGSV